MNKTNENMKLAKSMILSSALIAGATYGANAQTAREISRMQPMAESRMEVIAPQTKDFFAAGMSIEDIKENSVRFEIPMPSTAAVQAKDAPATESDKYALREIGLKQTVRYQNFGITLIAVGYSFKDISATFVVTAGEEEWKIKMYPNRKERIDYLDHDNEKAWRLNFVVDQINSYNKVTIKLLQERITPEEANRSKKE